MVVPQSLLLYTNGFGLSPKLSQRLSPRWAPAESGVGVGSGELVLEKLINGARAKFFWFELRFKELHLEQWANLAIKK